MNQRAERLLTYLGALAVPVCFLAFNWRGLFIDFMPDDLMNCALARAESWSRLLAGSLVWFLPVAAQRPMGGLVYWLSYEWFGTWMLPMRVLAYALLLLSFWLLWRLARACGAGAETAALACLLWSGHPALYALYFNNGTIYDVLCSCLSLSVAVLYTGARAAGRETGPWRTAAMALLYALALSSKETAVATPAILLAWELLFGKDGRPRWRAALTRPVVLLGAMSLPWLYLRLAGAAALTSMEAYRPEYSWPRWNASFHSYMSELLNRPESPDAGFSYAALLMLLALSLRLRSAAALFGLALFALAYLPLAFVAARSPYAIHLSLAGLALAAAAALEGATRALLAGRGEPWRRAALLAACVWALAAWQTGPPRNDVTWITGEARAIRSYWAALEQAHIQVPPHGTILLLDDPLARWQWGCTFASQLYYRDAGLLVVGEERAPFLPQGRRDWDQVWRWRAGALARLKSGPAGAPAE